MSTRDVPSRGCGAVHLRGAVGAVPPRGSLPRAWRSNPNLASEGVRGGERGARRTCRTQYLITSIRSAQFHSTSLHNQAIAGGGCQQQ